MGLRDLPLEMHAEIENTRHSYWMCSILVNNKAYRQLLRSYLAQVGIETRPVFYPAHTLPHCKKEGYFPQAIDISERGINLPSFPGLSFTDVEKITTAIRTFFREVRKL
ncbi:MAG: DegT/DnrJ/EryC1/StrS family aminotransferase [Legionella sp.]|uniref:DegT/DnrJ/EryC1/StrS family aminotransferase n=1 Tax=Legionella sp. TaxID=459 RepID=UPI0039E43F22